MELILLQKVINLGEIGDKVDVRAGYGRNCLLPQGKALAATKENLAEFESRREELEKASAERIKQAQARASELEGMELNIEAHAGPGGKLFGSIGPAEIAQAISEKGITVEKSEVDMPEGPIRQTGESEIHLILHTDVDTNIKLVITEAETAA